MRCFFSFPVSFFERQILFMVFDPDSITGKYVTMKNDHVHPRNLTKIPNIAMFERR